MSLISLIARNDIDGVRKFSFNEINKAVALIIASQLGHIEIVKLLLTNETINVNLRNDFGNTALILASWNENIEIIKLLLEHETIDVNLQDKNGNTALVWASENNNIEIVKLLLTHETIKVNLQNCYGNTVLFDASRKEYIEIVKLLLNAETINVNLQNDRGGTALIYASRPGNIEVVELLLAKGAAVPLKYCYSDDINEVLTNWKTYLPRWDRFKTFRYYPKEFQNIATLWLLICKRKNFVSKDIKLLMIEYLAESWKLN